MSYTPAPSPPFPYHAHSPSPQTYSLPSKRVNHSGKQSAMSRSHKSGPSSVKGRGRSSNTPGSRAPSLLSGRSRPGSLAESDNIGPYSRRGRKSGTPGSALGRGSRPGSTYRGEYREDGDDQYDDGDEDDDGEEMASDYGDNEEGEGVPEPGVERKLLTAEEEHTLEEMGRRDADLQSLRKLMDRDQQRRLDELKSTNFTFQSIQKVYRDRYPGGGHIAKNVAALVGVVAKTHVGEIIELAKIVQSRRLDKTRQPTSVTTPLNAQQGKALTVDDLKEAQRIYFEEAGLVRGTTTARIGQDNKGVLFGGWI